MKTTKTVTLSELSSREIDVLIAICNEVTSADVTEAAAPKRASVSKFSNHSPTTGVHTMPKFTVYLQIQATLEIEAESQGAAEKAADELAKETTEHQHVLNGDHKFDVCDAEVFDVEPA